MKIMRKNASVMGYEKLDALWDGYDTHLTKLVLLVT
jgi:hypothetical protein